jgi:hypothetical protein
MTPASHGPAARPTVNETPNDALHGWLDEVDQHPRRAHEPAAADCHQHPSQGEAGQGAAAGADPGADQEQQDRAQQVVAPAEPLDQYRHLGNRYDGDAGVQGGDHAVLFGRRSDLAHGRPGGECDHPRMNERDQIERENRREQGGPPDDVRRHGQRCAT